MSVFLKCGSLEKMISNNSQPEDACSKFCTKYEGPILLILSVVFAVLTVLVAYGYIPPCGGAVSMFNVGLVTGCGMAMSILSFQVGLIRTLHSQGCLIVRKDSNADSTEQPRSSSTTS